MLIGDPNSTRQEGADTVVITLQSLSDPICLFCNYSSSLLCSNGNNTYSKHLCTWVVAWDILMHMHQKMPAFRWYQYISSTSNYFKDQNILLNLNDLAYCRTKRWNKLPLEGESGWLAGWSAFIKPPPFVYVSYSYLDAIWTPCQSN